ncbi:type I-U CRISPR-associated helicase/endonuclease Cas3 [Streptomyces sp. NPDC021622]|uniref:type I-G CRISPR-associated helicase/endonuclease Cas3g n=1 Tax=Streptomyces sp. NPDC021622 TaxID=3155013 RepID=UPI0033D09F4D
MSHDLSEQLLIPQDFPAFFKAVHGHPPFPWQIDYLNKVAAGEDWPDLDVPTGLGKTSLIDIWIFLLAWQHACGRRRTVPLRLFFVVDRRLVVDQAHDHAKEKIRKALDQARKEGQPQNPDTGDRRALVLYRVAEALADLGGQGVPLEVVRMRGGLDWSSRWLRSPSQPAVITSTVDQYGSRLLFRGYHTSARMRPVDAALCGIDALLAVDEAHIAQPLLQTALDCARYQATATHPEFANRAVKVVSLSATARTDDTRQPHTIGDLDHQNETAGKRLRAAREVTLLDAAPAAKDSADAFATAAEDAVQAMLPLVERPVIGVVANTIRTARAAHRQLTAHEGLDTVLLTGRSRTHDREQLLASAPLRELLDGVSKDRERPLVIVATQTVEVGLDVSFAGLVTENASYAALIQRLGRLDRKGDFRHAPAVVIRASAPQDPAATPVYGAAAQATWDWLAGHAPIHEPPGFTTDALQPPGEERLVINATTLPGLLKDADREAMNTPAPLIPVVHRTLVHSWARTSPAPVPDQSPAPFLHGLATSPEDVHVLWRSDLPTTPDGQPQWERWKERMHQLPPHQGEAVAIPAQQLRRFLTQPGNDTTSDLEGVPEDDDRSPSKRKPRTMAPVLSWDDTNSQWEEATEPRDIRPGGTYVLPSSYSGHDAYGWTATPGQPVVDLGDFPPRVTTAATRLEAGHLALLMGADDDARDAMAAAITEAHQHLRIGDEDHTPTAVIHQLLDTLLAFTNPGPQPGYPVLAHERLEALRQVAEWDITPEARGETTGHTIFDPRTPERLVLVPNHPQRGITERAHGVGDDADTSSFTRRVALAHHAKTVAARAKDLASQLGLPDDLVATVTTGAHAHDAGKHHPRFQAMLCGGDRLLAEAELEPLAKSGMDAADYAGRRRAARLAQWDTQLRHEALSAAAVQTWLTTRPDYTAGQDEELLIHLVAAHHGHARPLLPPVPDPDPLDVECAMPDGTHVTVNSATMGIDWDGPDRFARLNQRYGPWGLAMLETLVRLADMACSEEGN